MEIEAEAIDSTKINRCEHCRRVQFGHPVPYGLEKCKLERITTTHDVVIQNLGQKDR